MKKVNVRVPADKDLHKMFLAKGLPIESHLSMHLFYDYFFAKIDVKTIKNKQDAMVSFAATVTQSAGLPCTPRSGNRAPRPCVC